MHAAHRASSNIEDTAKGIARHAYAGRSALSVRATPISIRAIGSLVQTARAINYSIRAVHSPRSASPEAAFAKSEARILALNESQLKPGTTFFCQPLWPEGPPKGLRPRDIGETLLDTDPDFAFWKRWYEGMVAGRPLDWELQRRIALIDDTIWKEGASAVAREIERIEADWLAERLPLAETVVLDPDTGRFDVIPALVQNAPLTGALISAVQDALDDAVSGNNGLNERSTTVRILSRSCTRHANDPQRLEMDFTRAAIGLRRQFDTDDLPQSEDNLHLLDSVEEAVRGLRAAHPEVAANRQILAQAKLSELDDTDRALLQDAAPILDEITQGTLQEDFAEDLAVLADPQSGATIEVTPGSALTDPAIRTVSRVSKMWRLSVEASESDAHKVVQLGTTTVTVGQWLWQLVQLGLKLFGVA